jgi:hypothetical protein
MLKEHLEKLTKSLKVSLKEEKKKFFSFTLTEKIHLDFEDLKPGYYLYSNICETPEEKLEDLFIYLLKANFLGNATGGNAIGITNDEKNLTLSFHHPYEINYDLFKENVEDFVNYLVYWKMEVDEFIKKSKSNLI